MVMATNYLDPCICSVYIYELLVSYLLGLQQSCLLFGAQDPGISTQQILRGFGNRKQKSLSKSEQLE